METNSGRNLPDEKQVGLGLEIHLGYWLRRVSNRVSGAFARTLHARRVSVAEWVLLRHLQERQSITPGELAEALGLTRGAVSKVLDKLVEKNWIARATKPEDNRVQLISMTRHGRRALPQLAEIADRNDEEFFDCLDAHERATLRRLLRKLADFHRIKDVPIE
jgi:DNA-binding MarR family transcriptional regulator